MTYTTYPAKLATEKQVAFIRTLADERVLTMAVSQAVLTVLVADKAARLKMKDASTVISALLSLPKKPVVKAVAAPVAGVPTNNITKVEANLVHVPDGMYALPSEVLAALSRTRIDNDLLFVAVRTWKGRTHLRRLHGAPGGFSRSRLDMTDSVAISAVLANSPLKWTQLFAAHYSCCGRCGADLTDETSRALGLGPTCRKAYNL